jgi:glycosyltransferase involved in cell wall biosynthesis
MSQYFWPESFIINDLAKTLSAQGHVVKVLTGKPNYPAGAIFEGYQQSNYQEEVFGDDITVFRAPLRPRGRGNSLGLILNYMSFIWNGLRFFGSSVENEAYDIILVFAPSPITSAIPALYLKRELKCPMALWVQDLWPESLSATGHIKNKFVLKAVGYIVEFIYKKADLILVQSQAFSSPVSKYTEQEKVHYFPNMCKEFDLGASSLDLPEEFKDTLEKYFCIVFAGNIGKAQSIETLINAAESLADIENLKFVLVGQGSRLEWAKSEVRGLALKNVEFAGSYPPEMMPEIFTRSKALIVSLKAEEIFSYTIPSKVQSYLAAGKPILASINGEAVRVINEAEAGLVSPAEDADGFSENVRKLYDMSSTEQQEMGKNGLNYFKQHFEMEKQAQKLIEIFQNRMQ